MAIKKKRWFPRSGSALLLAVLFVLLCASCSLISPDGWTPEKANGKTAGITNITESAALDEGASSIRLMSGATIALTEPVGLRVTGVVDKDYLDSLKVTYGNAVKVGVLFAKTDDLTANALDFTVEALDACNAISGKKYEKIETAPELSDNGVYCFNCDLTDLAEDEYRVFYSAVAYVEAAGKILRYSTYTDAENSVSLSGAAEKALFDLSDTQTEKYSNPTVIVAGVVKYSPYTEEQRAVLQNIYYGNACTLTVMSYNIEYKNGNDSGRSLEKEIQTVRSVSPDIVGLQEVDSGWNGYISDLTASGYTRIKGDTSRTNWPELCYKTAKFNELGSGYVRYSTAASRYPDVPKNGADTSRDQQGRLFTWALLEEKDSGKKIIAISTHLHYRKDKYDKASTDANALVRQYEIRLLLAWIEDRVPEYDCAVIMGDMNEHYLDNGRGKAVIDVYRAGGFTVTRDTAAIKDDVGGTLAEQNRTTRPQWIFDYILTKGNVNAVYFTVLDNKIDNGNTSYPSDHVPVVAKISIH